MAHTGHKRCSALLVGHLRGHREKLGIIVKAEINTRSLGGTSVGIIHPHVYGCSRSVVRCDIYKCVGIRLLKLFFRAVISAEHLGGHKHSTRSRGVEPAEVKHRFRLAGT